MDGLVMGELVVAVTTENYTLINLEDPIKLTFKRNTEVKDDTTVALLSYAIGIRFPLTVI